MADMAQVFAVPAEVEQWSADPRDSEFSRKVCRRCRFFPALAGGPFTFCLRSHAKPSTASRSAQAK